MGDDVVLAKFTKLSRCITRIRQKTPASAELLKNDVDAQDIITLNIERAVQICVDMATNIVSDAGRAVPDNMADAFTALAEMGTITAATAERMRKAVGFRNIAVHEYDKIDWNIVYAIVTQYLDDFSSFAQEVTKHIGAR